MEETALSYKGPWRDPRRKQFCPLRAIGGTLEEEVLSQKGPLRDPRRKQFCVILWALGGTLGQLGAALSRFWIEMISSVDFPCRCKRKKMITLFNSRLPVCLRRFNRNFSILQIYVREAVIYVLAEFVR